MLSACWRVGLALARIIHTLLRVFPSGAGGVAPRLKGSTSAGRTQVPAALAVRMIRFKKCEAGVRARLGFRSF
jgi:hypothetical protein